MRPHTHTHTEREREYMQHHHASLRPGLPALVASHVTDILEEPGNSQHLCVASATSCHATPAAVGVRVREKHPSTQHALLSARASPSPTERVLSAYVSRVEQRGGSFCLQRCNFCNLCGKATAAGALNQCACHRLLLGCDPAVQFAMPFAAAGYGIIQCECRKRSAGLEQQQHAHPGLCVTGLGARDVRGL